jgi:hypothetical protein
MKKTISILGLALLAGALTAYCGGGGGTTDPKTAEAAFDNPTGKVSDANAEDAVRQALAYGTASTIFSGDLLEGALGRISPQAAKVLRIRAESGIEDCMTPIGDGGGVEIDVACAAQQNEGCSGSGTIRYTTSGDMATVTFNAVSLACPSDEIDLSGWNGEFLFLFASDIEGALTPPQLVLFCGDVSGTTNGKAESFNGCVTNNGHFLVDGEGGSVVATDITKNADCSRVCVEFTTTEGPVNATCNVTAPTGGWEEIEEVDACVVSVNASCTL